MILRSKTKEESLEVSFYPARDCNEQQNHVDMDGKPFSLVLYVYVEPASTEEDSVD